MKLYKNSNNEIFAYELDGSQDHLIGDKVPITKEHADEIIVASQTFGFNSLSYVEKRRSEYPPIGDQLDALYHAGAFNEEMSQRLKTIKEKYPKPTN